VVMIDPAHIPANRVAPPVHIDRVRANGVESGGNDRLVAPPGKGELEFHFTALSFVTPQKIRLRYLLKGYDKDWVETGERRMAFYTNLKPGRYTFTVIAANADGIWNTTGDSIEIQLLPHFYQTAWFYLPGGALTLAVLIGIYLWRVRHLERKQQALQTARDLLEIEVQNRTAELAEANASLKQEVEDHKRTEAQLEQRTRSLENEIEERKQMELEVERAHRDLVDASRQAGMAEVATSVLHNVGNVLNSVNVSATLVSDQLKKSKSANLSRVVGLMRERSADLGAFIISDPKGRKLPGYLAQLAEHLEGEQAALLQELELLRKNVEHIKDIVSMQQSYAKVSGVSETVKVIDLLEDTLRMNAGALMRHEVQVVREYDPHLSDITTEKHKVLQILVNLVCNAQYACDESGRKDKRVTVRATNGGRIVRIAVVDNGVGIPAENLTRIFNHGFTTRKEGHGFGLHSGALAARELGGRLTAHSDGCGRGATFTLELPLQPITTHV